MSETAADRAYAAACSGSMTETDEAYFAAGEAAFIRRRGTPFLLSPNDFALLKQWRQLGVPIEAVEQGIEEAFSRREERGAAGRVNSLTYCRDAVLSAWERRAETGVGKGEGRRAAPLDTAEVLRDLSERIEGLSTRRADLAAPLDSAVRSLARLAEKTASGPEEIESALARLDKRLAGALYEALPAPERAELDARVEALLAKARDRMDEETARKTARALARRTLREKLDLPRLTLLPL